jgi:hypothetical protein
MIRHIPLSSCFLVLPNLIGFIFFQKKIIIFISINFYMDTLKLLTSKIFID